MDLDELRNKYRREFVAVDYPDLVTAHSFLRHFHQRELHSIFESLPDRKRSLLDVGCGPTTYNVFPATKRAQDVVLSDYVLGNRVEVEKWWKNAPDALDWSCYSESLARLEGFSDVKRGAEEITTRTRNAVRKVIPCDVLDPRVLPEEHWEKFDVVLSCLCLESACPDEDSFRKAAQNVGGLVGDGGLLILCGVLGCREYTVGGVTFPCLDLTPDTVKDALVRAGFQVKLWRCLEESVRSSAVIESAFVVMAEKLKSDAQ
ncbi:nicotinamide N-methyltransferase [Ixodes scapularis]|uniref:nicotinamide N-methyltransferase n=1 Tax=Ixodes scapularis TaxID=6945 RepID=UPI001A9E1BDA|nr:nicotinamide N-methyltransferase [Ixodes scapularis]